MSDMYGARQVKRTQEEAEREMLEILQNLEADGMKSFQCLSWSYGFWNILSQLSQNCVAVTG